MDRQKNKRTGKAAKGEAESLLDTVLDTRESVDIGLDISTSIVGFAILNSTTGDLIRLDAIKLTGAKFEDVWDKANQVENELSTLLDATKYKVENVFVEEAHMRFTPGLSSAGTLFSLARFNGIASYVSYKIFDCKPKMTNVRSARKSLGIQINYKDKSKDTKTKVFEAVQKLNPNFPWIQHVAKVGKQKGKLVWSKHNFDMADAWVICEGGRRLLSPPVKKKK